MGLNISFPLLMDFSVVFLMSILLFCFMKFAVFWGVGQIASIYSSALQIEAASGM